MQRLGKPLYAIIANDIKNRVLSGNLNPGDMLPSENELATQYGTSRMTVRKGLQALENEGMIYPWQGKGYFVASPAHDEFVFQFTDEERGYELAYHRIDAAYPSEEVAAALDVAPTQIVIEVCRIIKKRGTPVALDIKYIPYDKGLPILEGELDYAVFPEIVAAKASPFTYHTQMEIEADLPSEQVAQLLQCPPDAPLLVAHRYLVDKRGRRVGYGVKYMLQSYGKLLAKSGYELI